MNSYHLKSPLIISQSSSNLQRKNMGSSPLAPFSSLNKENITNHHNKNHDKYSKNIYEAQNRNIVQHQYCEPFSRNPTISFTTQAVLEPRPASVDFVTLHSKQLLNHIQKGSQTQRHKKKQSQPRKKSVRFSEHSAQTIALNYGKEKQYNLPTRSRSTSILKNKVKSAKMLQSKGEGLLKTRKQSVPSVFSIGEYKNTLVRQRYYHLLRSYTKRSTEVHVKPINCRSLDGQALEACKVSKVGFVDSNFSCIDSSIFRTTRPSQMNIKWARISELFANKELLVVREGQSNVVSIRQQSSFAQNSFVTALNLIRSSRSLLYRIFQNSTYNEAGIYMLKIFANDEWRCVIIDDFIPIYCDLAKGITYPVFTNVAQLQAMNSDKLEIWPLLLEKAYASVLGSYQRVHEGSSLMDYLGKIMGLPIQKITLDWEKSSKLIEIAKGNEQQTIMFGFSKVEAQVKAGRLPFRVKSVVTDQQFRQQNFYFSCEELGTKMRIKISLSNLQKIFDELYVIRISTIQHLTSSNIKVPSRLNLIKGGSLSSQDWELATKGKFKVKRHRAIIRSFTVQGNEQVSFMLKRKGDCDGKDRQWLRIFLFMKELDSYRWIQGKYSAQTISFSSLLEPGQYFVAILPDWTNQQHTQLVLLLYSRVNPISLAQHHQHSPQTIIDKGCTDYAQRFGKMVQLNRWICTYALVDPQCGLIIQNINNESRNTKVKIYRSIANLNPNNCCILPFNSEFYDREKIKQQIEMTIEKENSWSVALLLFGGKDKAFLNSFNFGM